MYGNKLLVNSLKLIYAAIRYNVFWTLENPARSLMFLMPSVCKLLQAKSTGSVLFDQCMYGLHDPESKLLYQKRTRIIGNLPQLQLLCRDCSHDHVHEQIVGQTHLHGKSIGRSVVAGAYPPLLCTALAKAAQQAVAESASHRMARLRRQCPLELAGPGVHAGPRGRSSYP